jgi:acyl-CoA reductase-like NAD-dependent aldehyde dehydrogenase
VIEVIEGGPKAVESIIADESVRKVIFTGSYQTGRIISELCGRFFKPCLLELGGTGCAIVTDDADLVLAARGIAWSAFYSGGSSCVGTKRVFLTSETSRAFVPLLLAAVKQIRPGNPSDPNTEMGIARNRALDDRTEELIRDAVKKGAATWTLGGEIGDRPSQGPRGPVVLLQATPRMKILAPDGEWGGPVLCIRDVESIDQAVDEANRSSFGLGASVWSRDLRKAQAIARRLQAGIVWINDSSVGLPGFPWGGTKHSGWGRLLSREALTELTSLKVISRDRRLTSARKFWWFPYSKAKYEILLSLNEFLYGRRKGRPFRLFLRSWLRWMFR